MAHRMPPLKKARPKAFTTIARVYFEEQEDTGEEPKQNLAKIAREFGLTEFDAVAAVLDAQKRTTKFFEELKRGGASIMTENALNQLRKGCAQYPPEGVIYSPDWEDPKFGAEADR